MEFNSRESLKAEGFEGFVSVRELMCSCSRIPKKKGVYMVIYTGQDMPDFANPGVGGYFEGKDVKSIEEILIDRWVEGTVVIYIGKAGLKDGTRSEPKVTIPEDKKTTGRRPSQLRRRITGYMRYGRTGRGGHVGGRDIWWIRNHEDLILCWKDCESSSSTPRETEKAMIREFKNLYKNKRPFANRVD